MYATTGVAAKGCDVAVADVSGAIGPTRSPQILKGERDEQSSL
jgi:hypothetical protein